MLSFSLVGFLGLLAYWTGPELAFSIFYLVPVSLTAWIVGRRWGIAMAVAAMLCWLWVDLYGGNRYSQSFVPYWNAFIRFGYFMIVSYLFDFIKGQLARERELSRTDPLTGALNKLAFQEIAERELERVKRYPHPLSIAYIDLDNFKQVNDKYGHAKGDALLKEVVTTLNTVMRKTDAVARLGGDEFAVVMPETEADNARQAFIKAQASLLGSMARNGWPVTFSIGIVTFIDAPETVDELVSVADAFMYKAKGAGKNRILHHVVMTGSVPRAPEVAAA